LSKGGCLFEMKYWQDPAFKDLAVGATLPIRFTIHGETSPTELNCKAVRVVMEDDDLRMGLSFTADRQAAKGSVAKFVSYISKLLNN
jgi:hypothetical protein